MKAYDIKQQEIDLMILNANSDRGYANQANGIAFERKNWNIEKRNSILSILSSGSKSPIDVITIRKNYVLLITCKANGYLTPKERKDLDNLKAKIPSFCKIQLRYRVGRTMHKQWY